MLYTFRKFLWKRRQLRKIADEAFQKEAMAAYSLATKDDIIALKKYDEEAREGINKRIAGLHAELAMGSGAELGADSEDKGLKNDYEKRHRIRDLEKELEAIEITIKGRNQAIGAVEAESQVLRAQAQELWHRRKIFRTRF